LSAAEQPQRVAGEAASQPDARLETLRRALIAALGVGLCFFVLFEVNYGVLLPQSSLAVFVGAGLLLCFLAFPVHARLASNGWLRGLDLVLGLAAAGACAYVVVQTEPAFEHLWSGGRSLGNRAGIETGADIALGLVGLILVLEAARRSIGWIVPALALVFVAHTLYCYYSLRNGWPVLPDWLFPHAGQNPRDVVGTTFLQSLGVFGPAASVMFRYVFLFVVFGAFLEMSGATQFIMRFAERVFGTKPGGPAKVAVLSSGLLGSLSGSAVANAVTTGAFTIPMMRSNGFRRHVAAAVEAAAASGGALVPPVMGAGAYMMLEIIEPQVTFLQIVQAALLPAVLFYLSIFLIVHFYSRRIGTPEREGEPPPVRRFDAIVFISALGALILLLLLRFSPFRAVTGSLIVILLLAVLRKEFELPRRLRYLTLGCFGAVAVFHQLVWADTPADPSFRQVFESWLSSGIVAMLGLMAFGLIHHAWRPHILGAFTRAARNGIPLVAASACVGTIIGIVQQTGIAVDFSAAIKSVVATNLFLALLGIMVTSLVLGMGVPSVVCYLLMATLMGSLLSELGVIPLAAHLFIFYFGMMSMVTPPVALAAYAASSLAQAPVMPTALAAFRFALVGFTLPFMFVYRPALLLMDEGGGSLFAAGAAGLPPLLLALGAAVVGILALAAGVSGYLRAELSTPLRVLMLVAAALLLVPDLGGPAMGIAVNGVGAVLFVALAVLNRPLAAVSTAART
jgi:TRAP transporter 4TM/12TM fusion protein